MKKLIMFVMVLMLCLGTAARADLVAGYQFDGSLADCSGNGNDGSEYEGTVAYSSSAPTTGGSDGMSLDLDGTNAVEIPLAPAMFDGTTAFSIVAWFRTTDTEPSNVIISASSLTGSAEDDNAMAVLIFEGEDSAMVAEYDQFYVAAAGTETDGLNDGTWHHFAVVYDGSNYFTTYLDGAQDGENDGTVEFGGPAGYNADAEGSTILIGDILDPTWEGPEEDFGDGHFNGQLKDVGIYNHALSAGEVAAAMADGYQCYGPANPIAIDPNVMLVYETNTTLGDFDVSLKFPPVGQGGPGSPQGTPYEVTVLIDPNGINGAYGESTPGEKDIVLLDGAGADNTISLTFNTSNWDTPVTIMFQAIDDPCAEPPSLIEITDISVTITSTVDEPNLNGSLDSELNPWEAGDPKWSKVASASVKDNDQATILSVKEDGETEQTVPYKLLEEPLVFDWFGEPTYKEQTVRIVLQVEPKNDADPCTPLDAYVRVTMENEAEDNPPFADPCLVPGSANSPSEPNAIVFTVDGASVPGVIGDYHKWDVPYTIVIKADNDNELQAEPGESEGDENYETSLEFFVDATTDARYGEYIQQYDDQEDPIPGLFEWEALEKSVPIEIQDNECGAFGILSLDISNPYYVTDPNWVDEETGDPLPDCYVNIYDILEIATQWLDCDDPHDPIGCAPFPTDEEE